MKECGDPGTRRWLLQEMFGGEVRALSELDAPPQLILCAVSEPMTRFIRSEDAVDAAEYPLSGEIAPNGNETISQRSFSSFRGGLKAECMGFLPTELIWDQAFSRATEPQDHATRAWQLAGAAKDSCFIGISFYRPSRKTSPGIWRSFVQVVTELGDCFIVDGDDLEPGSCTEGEIAPHLPEAHARNLLSRALEVFGKEVGISPQKIVVHKSTSYSNAERRGFEGALASIRQYALMTIARRGIFCLRPGRKPILRGTAIPFDDKIGLVFAAGYVPFLRGYKGSRLPLPLEITENWGTIFFPQAAQDLMHLTKLDLNSPDFSADLPITLAHRREIGHVLGALGRKEPSVDSRSYI
jgi:hypothetical protein